MVVAPHGLALGGACEMSLHADKAVPAAETYTGLVEVGIGVIPGGGGTKEFVLRAADEVHSGEPDTIPPQNRFLTIATAKVATSAYEGFDLGIYRKGNDIVSINQGRRIAASRKQAVIELFDDGYVMPVQRTDIKVLGRSMLGAMHAGINGMWRGNYATDHDVTVAKNPAYVMCGGDLSEPTLVHSNSIYSTRKRSLLEFNGREENAGKDTEYIEERETVEELTSLLSIMGEAELQSHRNLLIIHAELILLRRSQ